MLPSSLLSRPKIGGNKGALLWSWQHCLCDALALSLSLSSLGDATSMIQISPVLFLLVIVNVVSLAIFGFDKLKSKNQGWRVSESRLLLVAFCGPFGACAGMLLFRHKIRKIKFLLVPIFLLIQLGLLVYFHPF